MSLQSHESQEFSVEFLTEESQTLQPGPPIPAPRMPIWKLSWVCQEQCENQTPAGKGCRPCSLQIRSFPLFLARQVSSGLYFIKFSSIFTHTGGKTEQWLADKIVPTRKQN